MAKTAALLVDRVLPERPLRQWMLPLRHALRFLLARNPAALALQHIHGEVALPRGATFPGRAKHAKVRFSDARRAALGRLYPYNFGFRVNIA